MKKISWPGHGWKYTCQRCGMQHPSTEIKKEWTGLHVCYLCFETRHPQTLIKITAEKAVPEFVSKDIDTYVGICSIATNSAYADLGASDCMQVDNNTFSYALLSDLFTNGHGGL